MTRYQKPPTRLHRTSKRQHRTHVASRSTSMAAPRLCIARRSKSTPCTRTSSKVVSDRRAQARRGLRVAHIPGRRQQAAAIDPLRSPAADNRLDEGPHRPGRSYQQARANRESSRCTFPVAEKADLRGTAWFADIWFGRLPRMTLAADRRSHLYFDDELPQSPAPHRVSPKSTARSFSSSWT